MVPNVPYASLALSPDIIPLGSFGVIPSETAHGIKDFGISPHFPVRLQVFPLAPHVSPVRPGPKAMAGAWFRGILPCLGATCTPFCVL